ncbi:hypothetical protein B0A55_03589 [Friedmanniomyces simplex]|uniref:Uncharacterized protein n=1 Tax=Friedmanniomyces simplex TaxID=329884 RepID=A0A4U0XUK6_9PEZI|nr:hypothetical protein B0A55_03589 [Friedmanniomyces simplex]
MEVSRIDDLRTRARQMGRGLDFADLSAATAATTPDQNHRPEDANNTETRVDQLYEQLAATQRQVDQLTLRLQEREFESTAQAKQAHDLTAELATLNIELRDGHAELTEGHANHGDGLTKLHHKLAELRDQHPTVESRMTKQTGSQQRRANVPATDVASSKAGRKALERARLEYQYDGYYHVAQTLRVLSGCFIDDQIKRKVGMDFVLGLVYQAAMSCFRLQHDLAKHECLLELGVELFLWIMIATGPIRPLNAVERLSSIIDKYLPRVDELAESARLLMMAADKA